MVPQSRQWTTSWMSAHNTGRRLAEKELSAWTRTREPGSPLLVSRSERHTQEEEEEEDQPVMAASSLQELAAMRNLTTCELDKRRHLVTDVRTSKRHMASSTGLATRCRSYLTHIPYIPKSFGSHLFCVNIRALLSASITCWQIRLAGH